MSPAPAEGGQSCKLVPSINHFPATFQGEDHALEIEQQVQDVLRHAVW